MIDLSHISKDFGDGEAQVHAVRDVSLKIADGDIFGVIGFSGAGKSTLVRCINLLERPTAGRVVVDGQEMMQLSSAQLRQARKKIGMIFQHFNLMPSRTVADNVAYPLRRSGLSKQERLARVRELLELVGIADKENAYPSQLSGGQKQRVAIARALANEPKVLLCDEATSALDPQTTKAILHLLREVNEKLGITIVLITHEMAVVKEICNRVAVIDHHPGGEPYWDAAVIRPEACAAGVLVAEFIEHCGGGLTSDMAQNLLTAIVTDTGRFQYQNADPEAFAVASALVNAGANPAEVSLNVYQSDRLAYLHLEAKVMSRIVTFNEGRISYSYATLEDINGGGVAMSECEGLVDVVRRVSGAEICLFLKEVTADKVRGNLRAKTDIDISGVARELGGGGHSAASGFTMEGDIDQVLSAALPRLHALLDGSGDGTASA